MCDMWCAAMRYLVVVTWMCICDSSLPFCRLLALSVVTFTPSRHHLLLLFFFLFFSFFFFFFNDTATTEIYTLSLHDALPFFFKEHASHLHSLSYLLCRLPL